MWHYSHAQRFVPPVQTEPAGPQSTHELLLTLRSLPLSVQYPDCEAPLPGFLEEVTPRRLSFGLAKPVPALPAGTLLTVEVPVAHLVHQFEAPLLSVAAAGTWLQVTMPSQVASVQRRQFTRVKVSAQLVYARTGGENGLGQVLDLSPGGLRFTTQTLLSPGDHLFLSLNTPDGAKLHGMEATVVRVQHGIERHTAAVHFAAMTAQLENDLMQAVLRLQGKR